METKGAPAVAAASLANTPFEPLASALLALHKGPAANDDSQQGVYSESLYRALLAEVGRFVDQWGGLRGWERKALADDGRALRLPLAAHLQALEDERRSKSKSDGPCSERYLPPAGAAPSSSSAFRAGASGEGGTAASAVPAYIPGTPAPASMPAPPPLPYTGASAAASGRCAPTLPPPPPQQQQQQQQQQLLECAWCQSKITDPHLLRSIAIQQVRMRRG